ncbi:hypothetical protein ACFSM5_16040 [Lacibacterium aquatile]|uniref:Uncharacterized protein n=1 Tax=Lacibacterium aquatile TaxID=1168082 RepID=A0ABW5DYW7_9PROT
MRRQVCRSLLMVAALLLPSGLLAQSSPVRKIDLNPTGQEKTEKGRKLLSYIISCALGPEVEAHISVDGADYVFRGAEGLVPDWADRAMTETERRRVSSCLLARTNVLGVKVGIYMIIGQEPEAEDVRIASNGQDFTLFEGMFFGDLFSEHPEGYACMGEAALAARRDPIFKLRRCATPNGRKTKDGQEISACDFVITGACSDPASFNAGGRVWSEVMQVWLRPHQPED